MPLCKSESICMHVYTHVMCTHGIYIFYAYFSVYMAVHMYICEYMHIHSIIPQHFFVCLSTARYLSSFCSSPPPLFPPFRASSSSGSTRQENAIAWQLHKAGHPSASQVCSSTLMLVIVTTPRSHNIWNVYFLARMT